MRLLFDEAHSEAWTIRPELAAAMQPAHPADSSYALAARVARELRFEVRANTAGALDQRKLAGVDVLVLAHPSHPKWERTTGSGSPRLNRRELDAIEAFVAAGGGLLVLGETEQDKYGNNVNALLARFGLQLENETVQDYEHCAGPPSWILASLQGGERGRRGDPLARVRAACLYRATTIRAARSEVRVLARTHASATTPGAPLIAAVEHGRGRVLVLGDSDLFGDDCLEQFDHRELWRQLLCWVAGREREPSVHVLPPRGAWATLREHTNALARLQAPDGSLAEGADRTAAAAHVEAIASALAALETEFPHQADYLALAVRDLRVWAEQGYERPDFTRALSAFRPELHREDGIRHLAFFPMYKQNGPREKCFEALIVRVPWPEWIAELERTRFSNPKFVPVQLVDSTRGYDSECAVLFPEMVSTAERPPNNFGAIFCDREAARLRRVAGAAADLLGLNLPADAALLLADPATSEQAYILWDLIHDRAHSHGELPFDPFMIRQRAPYWMYALEELRCDLTAFGQAAQLEAEGFAFARNVCYAILLDRLLRFPITGPRVRNYDGLGGQLLFAHLHRSGELRWEDNQLTIDWERVGDGVAALREQIAELYRTGIDRSKLAHWCAAHDLIAARVPPAAGSRWAASARRFEEREDPRPYVDLVLEDEFPLSLFYSSLKAKLAAELGERAPASKLAA
jgi:hypothetical protein